MKGYIDRFDSTIAGWAVDMDAPDRPVEILVESNGKEIYRCSAVLMRTDLISSLGRGEHGFSFDATEKNGFFQSMPLQIFALAESKHLLHEGDWVYEGMVARGSDNWLFLNTDFNQVNLRMAGKVGVNPDDIFKTALQFSTRDALLFKMNIKYISLIMPEKNVVCARYLPSLKVSELRPALLILEQAKKFNCRILYPVDKFIAEKADLFYKTDTHANAYGYQLIYKMLAQEAPEFFNLELLPSPVLNSRFCGDLGGKMTPPHFEETLVFPRPESSTHFYQYDRVKEVIDAGGRLRGEVVSILNRNAKKKLLVFGTSTAYAALPLVSCAFEQTLFVWENTFDYRIIELFSPDCVLWLPAERFLPMDVDDLKGLPTSFERIKALLAEKT